MCRICCSPPGNLGNHAGRLAVDKPFTGSPKVLLITTQGRPAHLTCGQNDSAYHNTPPKVVAKRETTPSFRSKCIAQSQQHKPPSLKREAACVRLVMALFPVSLAQAGTYPHGWYLLFKLQGERSFFPVRPIAHEKDWNITQVKNIFLVFFAGGKFAY